MNPNEATSPQINPWVPMTRPIDLKHLNKLNEELGEAISASSRCLCQGLDEVDPVTKFPNRQWLQDELADVLANVRLVVDHFGLDSDEMHKRVQAKCERLRVWHGMLATPSPEMLRQLLRELRDEDRDEVFRGFCSVCHRVLEENERCHCWNDE